MTKLRLADDLHLPIETATETTLIVGKRGGGKSNTAVVMAEEFYRAKVPFAVLDPVDTWFGLKAGKDGSPNGGLGIYVFGGEHADIPLEPTAGSLMADVLVEHRISAVFVLRQFSNRQKAQFVSDFASQLFRRNREVLHLFCEEAHEVMPQQPFKGEEEMLGRMLKLQKLGRSSGIGLTSVTQRPASLNKNATTQAEILIAHRLLGPQDVAAVEAWIKHHHVDDKKQEVLSTLPTLKTGEAWWWAPDFPESDPIGLRRVKIRLAHTFDSRKTPKPGERRTEITALAEVDLDKLRVKMAGTIEKAKADDPRQLRAKIAQLERELHLAQKVIPAKSESKTTDRSSIAIIKRLNQTLEYAMKFIVSINSQDFFKAAGESVDKDKIHAAINSAVQSAVKLIEQNLAQRQAAFERWQREGQRILAMAEKLMTDEEVKISVNVKHNEPFTVTPLRDARAVPRGHGTRVTNHSVGDPGSTAHLPGSQQRILNALRWAEGIGLTEMDKTQVALMSDQRPTSGGYFNNLGALRSAGLLSYPRPGMVQLTELGLAHAEAVDVPTTSDELQQMLFQKLPAAQVRILEIVIGCYPKAIDKERLAEQSQQRPTSGGYFNNLGRLRSLGLIDYPSPGQVVAQPVLFLERN